MSSKTPSTSTEARPGDAALGKPADRDDERLVTSQSPMDSVRETVRRIRGGDLGSIPVVLGLVVIAVVFYSLEPIFLSSRSLVTMMSFAAPVGMISLGIVLVLLLGEIDLSVGSVSGVSAAVMAVLVVYQGQPLFVGLLAGLGTGLAIGIFYAIAYTRLGVPSFVFSLAGLLGFLGLQLFVLGPNGTVNLPVNSGLITFTRQSYVSGFPAYVIVVVIGAVYFGSQLLGIKRRRAADLSAPSLVSAAVKATVMTAVLLWLTWYLSIDRGWSYMWLLFVALVVLMDLALRRTTWGRHVFAVGGNEEAARRSGIKVTRIYVSVFCLTSTLAALGGIMGAGYLTSVSQQSGATDVNLTAIAAAVIGGTSLFGGRGSAWAALLGILVLQSIQTGLNLVGVDSSVRYMVTGAVLLLAVSIDSISRRARSSSGRG